MGCYGYICRECGTPIRGDCFSGGEKCVMIHVRHGKEVGRVEGHYDEYGRVIEQNDLPEEEKFNGDNDGINGHREICESEFDLEDSFEKVIDLRLYKGKKVSFSQYCLKKFQEDLESVKYNFEKLNYADFIKKCMQDPNKNFNAALIELYNKYKENYSKYVTLSDEGEKFFSEVFMFAKLRIILEELLGLFYNKKNAYFRYQFERLETVKMSEYSGIVAYHSVCYRKAVKEGTFKLIPSELDPNQSWGTIRKKYS